MEVRYKELDYDEVFAQSSPTNCTVYAGGCTSGDENALRRAFGHFGRIMKVWYFKDKGYAFVKYDNKESACNAIVALHLTAVGGQVLKCSWGKEGGGRQPSHESHDHSGGGGGEGYNSNQATAVEILKVVEEEHQHPPKAPSIQEPEMGESVSDMLAIDFEDGSSNDGEEEDEPVKKKAKGGNGDSIPLSRHGGRG